MFVIEMLVVLIHSLKMAHRDEKSLGNMPSCLTSLLFDYRDSLPALPALPEYCGKIYGCFFSFLKVCVCYVKIH